MFQGLTRNFMVSDIKDKSVFSVTKGKEMEGSEIRAASPSPSKRAYVSVAILFFINLLNYMDRYTVAGKSFLYMGGVGRGRDRLHVGAFGRG